MTVVAITVFVVAYVLIASDRVNKTLVALSGAAVVAALGVVASDDLFFSRKTGIDWDVIFLLFGMMVIVSVLRQTGVFEYISIWAAKRAKGSPLRIMILLVVVTAVASALLDNVTTVLLIAPVTLLVCDRLDVRAAPSRVWEAIRDPARYAVFGGTCRASTVTSSSWSYPASIRSTRKSTSISGSARTSGGASAAMATSSSRPASRPRLRFSTSPSE